MGEVCLKVKKIVKKAKNFVKIKDKKANVTKNHS